jgi:hypothetical protein
MSPGRRVWHSGKFGCMAGLPHGHRPSWVTNSVVSGGPPDGLQLRCVAQWPSRTMGTFTASNTSGSGYTYDPTTHVLGILRPACSSAVVGSATANPGSSVAR